jgi:hypothetical protein
MNLINPKRSTPQQETIAKLSEENKFIASGSAKGYSVDNFSWIADFLFKSPQNTFINKHTASVSFFSDREIVNQEFGNVKRLTENYEFFNEIVKQKLSPHTFEMTKKQYSTVSGKGYEFDSINYLNISSKEKLEPPSETHVETLDFFYPHEFWRAPAFAISGYRASLDNAANVQLGLAPYYDRYYWSYQWCINTSIQLNSTTVNIKQYTSDVEYPNGLDEEIFSTIETTSHIDPGVSNIRRMLDVKINVDNAKYSYFEESLEWVNYYNDTMHYYNQAYFPHYGIVNFYDDDWNEIHPKEISRSYAGATNSNVSFFPAIIRNSVLEPAKIIATWRPKDYLSVSGKMTFNNGVSLNESDDQSRAVYNVCRHMVRKPETVSEPFLTDSYLIYKKVGSNYLYCGVDVDTERNRRYSSVVMTEPYFTTTSLGNGEIVSYMFVKEDGTPADFNNNAAAFKANPNIFLKIKTSKSIIAEIDQLLKSNEYNRDVIETIVISEPVTNRSKFSQGPDYYVNFGLDESAFWTRQDDCIDDLIGNDTGDLGIVGQGKHAVFTIDPTIAAIDQTKYTTMYGEFSATMKVCGVGFASKHVKTYGSYEVKNYINLYCTNYYPTNAPKPSEYNPIPNQILPFITDASIISSKKSYERFCPMIKISGINGYIKILERNESFKTTRAKDGGYEVVYSVEFPYCPGSYSERVAMNFTDYSETWILKKQSYIPAGSWEASADTRFDVDNPRYAPFADDSFCPHSVITQRAATGTTKTASFKNGGGEYRIEKTMQNLVSYPSSMIWDFNVFNLLSLTKPRLNKPDSAFDQYPEFRRYGTYDIRLSENVETEQSVFSKDIKLIGLVDNRKWQFAENKFISYIGRENPSYICEIDTATLFEDFTKYQKENAALPDMKRWLGVMFSGLLYSAINVDNTDSDENIDVITENVNTILNNDTASKDSNSDIVIEAWDQTLNNWRPLSPISSDTEKVAGQSLLNNLYVVRDSDEYVAEFPSEPNMYTVQISYLDKYGKTAFPDFVKFNTVDDILNGKSNIVLFNSDTNRTYHIAYIKADADVYLAYIYYDKSLGLIPTFDIENIEAGSYGPFSICIPKKQLNKNISFKLYASSVVQGIVDNIIIRFIDIRKTGTSADLERFIDDNKKLYFRIRPLKDKNYKISYEGYDESKIQYLWDSHAESIGVTEWVNFPWTNDDGATFDQAFDWKKILTKEIVKKFGMTYFKCYSK